jgi:hypothetical protein
MSACLIAKAPSDHVLAGSTPDGHMTSEHSRSDRCLRVAWIVVVSCLGTAPLGAQNAIAVHAVGASPASIENEWRAWAFGRVGAARTSRVAVGSIAGGIAVSDGAILGMVRAADNQQLSFGDQPEPDVRDYALLAGVRSRGDRLFVVAAAGVARATWNDNSRVSNPSRHFASAFDVSAHADYRVAGLTLAVSGILGAAETRYVALTLGAELGRFGR